MIKVNFVGNKEDAIEWLLRKAEDSKKIEKSKCESYKPDKVGGCQYLDIIIYPAGTSRYCKWFNIDIYEIEDCPLRPCYSGEIKHD